jgi:Tol biopolymer transport system component
MVLGTVGYMSPEQVRGRAADHRADIFSFGAILYEMVAGQRAFHRDTPADTMMAILKEEPPELPPAAQLPPALDRIIRHCLEKNPEERFRSAHDLAFALENVSGVSSSALAAAGIAAGAGWATRWRRALPWAAAALALILAGALAVVILRTPSAPAREAMRFTIPLPEGYSLYEFGSIALSPDGTRLVYAAERDGRRQLFLRPLDSLQAVPIPGTEDGSDPFFSPDGRWLGFSACNATADCTLKKMPPSGGEPAVICHWGTWAWGGTWAADDTIFFISRFKLFRVAAAGGAPTVAFPIEGGAPFSPAQVLPDGKTLLLTTVEAVNRFRTTVSSLDGGNRRVVLEGAILASYTPPGHILFLRDNWLFAVPFDLQARRLSGPAVPLVEMATVAGTSASFAASSAGHLVYAPKASALRSAQRTLTWVDRRGQASPIPVPPEPFGDVTFSPDGKLLALVVQAAEHNVWKYDLARGAKSRLTFGNWDTSPVWAPDGQHVAYVSGNGPAQIISRAVGGQGTEEVLWRDAQTMYPRSYSPDGRWLAVERDDPNTQFDICLLSTDPDRKLQPLLNSRFAELFPEFSPDGRWLVYTSNETGRTEVYVGAINVTGDVPAIRQKWQISADGGSEPRWSRNSRELFFRSGNKFLSVEYQSQPAFTPSKPRMLFEAPYVTHSFVPAYAVHPDGRLLMMKASSGGINELHVILNWTDLLKHPGSAPSGKSEPRP